MGARSCHFAKAWRGNVFWRSRKLDRKSVRNRPCAHGHDAKLPKELQRGYKNSIDCVIRIAREEGVTTLWRGAPPTVCAHLFSTRACWASHQSSSPAFPKRWNGNHLHQNDRRICVRRIFLRQPHSYAIRCHQVENAKHAGRRVLRHGGLRARVLPRRAHCSLEGIHTSVYQACAVHGYQPHLSRKVHIDVHRRESRSAIINVKRRLHGVSSS